MVLLLSCTVGLELPNSSAQTVPATPEWLELPQMRAEDGLEFFTRSCQLGDARVRNYSFYWDGFDRLSHWVAYPLCSAYLGSSGRSDAWGYDPLLPAGRQQDISGGYQKGNDPTRYDRGHQIPSADRTASYSLNITTFYATNMTPQNNAFNGGIWATLEGRVRDWARQSDTLYVVTGCVMDGSRSYVLDRSSVTVRVPTAYYKAVLRYSADVQQGHGGFLAAGFWFEHKDYDDSPKELKAHSLSLSELESRLGYALFVNLPRRVGTDAADAIKKETPATVAFWWQGMS